MTALDPAAPLSTDQMRDLLVACFGWDPADVERRLIREQQQSGYNVVEDFVAHRLVPFEWSARLAEFYEGTSAFVFELLVYNSSPERLLLRRNILNLLAEERARRRTPLAVCFWGDGLGFDSLAASLADRSDDVTYFDVGGLSVQFARFIFDRALAPVRVAQSVEQLRARQYNVLVAVDVLEHLPDPGAWATASREMVGPEGLVVIKEAFDAIIAARPTHLRSNARFAYATPKMFEERGFVCERFGNFPYVFRATSRQRRVRWRERLYHELTAPIKKALLIPRLLARPNLAEFLDEAGRD